LSSVLHRLPTDFLKIGLLWGKCKPITEIIKLSAPLGLATVAEGIETQQPQQLGCELGQGYLFSKPLAANEIEARFFKGWE
jgi:EAL domain-containing protein (putative c-di-GMP-specific phosphodiesterase class I)